MSILYFDDVIQAREYLKCENHQLAVIFEADNKTASVFTFKPSNSREQAEEWVSKNFENMGIRGRIVPNVEGEKA